jgi:hypothetical protein
MAARSCALNAGCRSQPSQSPPDPAACGACMPVGQSNSQSNLDENALIQTRNVSVQGVACSFMLSRALHAAVCCRGCQAVQSDRQHLSVHQQSGLAAHSDQASHPNRGSICGNGRTPAAAAAAAAAPPRHCAWRGPRQTATPPPALHAGYKDKRYELPAAAALSWHSLHVALAVL